MGVSRLSVSDSGYGQLRLNASVYGLKISLAVFGAFCCKKLKIAF